MAAKYMKRSMLLLCLVAYAAIAAANTTPDTTGGQIEHAPGYTFGSKVGGYLRLSTDVCDIKSTIGTSDNPPYAEARKIYVDGRNSFKNDGSIRTLRELATKSYAGEPVFDMYAEYFGTAAFLDQPVSFAFAGDAPYLTVPQRNETIVKGLESNLQTVYLLHELDEAAIKIKDRKLSPVDGAPHNIDETWAIYVGERPDCSLWGASHRRAREFGTMQDCNNSKVNAGMLAAHRALYKAASDGDMAAFNAQVAEVQRLFLITYIQATLKYAELLDRAVATGDKETIAADQAEGHMFFRTIEPFIARANNRSAEAIRNVLYPGNPAPPNALAIVQPALEATYGKLGITPADIGTFGAQQELGCTPTSAAGAPVVKVGMSVAAVLALLVFGLF